MRFLSVLMLAAVGAVLGSVGGFFTSVFLHPEASPTYTFWGLFVGMADVVLVQRGAEVLVLERGGQGSGA